MAFALLVCILICSCNSVVQKNKIIQKKVSLICLRESDTVYVKITNSTDSIIYIPEKYNVDFTNNDDTLHFETVNKPKYGTTYYYKYKSIFPFEFYSTRKISGYKADTIEQYSKQVFFFNQFRVQPILPISPGSSYIVKLEFDVPKYSNIIQAVYYKKPFLNKERLTKFDYTITDFLKFDSINAIHVNSPILIRYR